jgi:predicted RNA-binding protein with PIN domain
LKEYLIVDGYNVINGWDELKAESVHSLEVSRLKLLDIMSDYQGYIERYVAGLCEAPGQRANFGSCCNKKNPKIRSTLEKWRRENTKT